MHCPYADLYIYRIEGRWDSRAAIGGPFFYGRWQEERSNFLFFAAPAETDEGIVSDGMTPRTPQTQWSQ